MLIDDAFEAGRIDDATALRYGVLAVFDPSKLPRAFRGNDDENLDGPALREAMLAWSALDQQSKSALAPYFVPPIYEGSWASESNRRIAARQPVERRRAIDDLCDTHGHNPLNAWSYAQGTHTRIWYTRSEDAANAQALAAEVDAHIWSKVSELMGAPPKDGGLTLPCMGGDERIDVALLPRSKMEGAEGYAIPLRYVEDDVAACPSDSFLILGQENSLAELKQILAHELFHAVQFGYSMNACEAGTWLTESTATWAIDHVYPGPQGPAGGPGTEVGNYEHQFAAGMLSADPFGNRQIGMSLFTDEPDDHAYDSYLFWFTQIRADGDPQVIRAAYDALGSGHFTDALDVALGGKLDRAYARFSLLAQNLAFIEHSPIELYHLAAWDLIAAHISPGPSLEVYPPPSDETEWPARDGPSFALRGFAAERSYWKPSEGVREIEIKPLSDDVKVAAYARRDGSFIKLDLDEKRAFCLTEAEEAFDRLFMVTVTTSQDANVPPGGAWELITRSACPDRLEGTLTISQEHQDTRPIFSGEIGAHNWTYDATADVKLSYIPNLQTSLWENEGSTLSISGSGSGFDTSRDCRSDTQSTFTGTSPPNDPIFTVSPSRSPTQADLQWIVIGQESRTIATTGDPERCAVGTTSDQRSASYNLPCNDAVVREVDERLEAVFDTEVVSTNGETTTRCTGTLREP